MCDTLAIVGPEGVLFAKNSDRDANEAQLLDWQPRQTHPPGARLKCTWIEIPEVAQTHAVLLSRPYWMWGAEMGTNEHGVTIGNEAVFTREPYAATGLTGMDLLRLALERAATAESAVRVIVELLETFGQGGVCSVERSGLVYHNSFIVADLQRAFVLETAGRHHAIEEIRGARSISNGLTISPFAERHSDWLKTRVSACRLRRGRTQPLAERATGVRDLMGILARSWARRRGAALFTHQRRAGCALRSCGRDFGRFANDRFVGRRVATRRGAALGDRHGGALHEPVQTGGRR